MMSYFRVTMTWMTFQHLSLSLITRKSTPRYAMYWSTSAIIFCNVLLGPGLQILPLNTRVILSQHVSLKVIAQSQSL